MSTSSTTPGLSDLEPRLGALMRRDEVRLRERLRRIGSASDRGAELAKMVGEVEAAERRIQSRRESVPVLRYPQALPLVERKDDILAAITESQVVIVAGDTGSGKTTQLPKICLEAGRGVRGLIGHTQPRRIAARTVAERIAEVLEVPLGQAVGYTVRFTDRAGEASLVKVMTDGILLAELQRDRQLDRYDTLIIDEAHERSLNIDFLLGYLAALLPRRPDLKLIVTSATIDTERFSRHFDDAPIIQVAGRTHPVEVRYRPVNDEGDDRDQIQAIGDAVDELSREGPGDILVFLSGEREIRDTADALTTDGRVGGALEVVPLYARLSPAEQHRVFEAHTGRRVVLATNVAETSLTVPGIRYVVDPGTARISRFNRRTKVQRLPIEPVSQASANQRAGRCGRVAPGICIRLYSSEDFEARPEYTEPEILRTNLASVILQMTALDLGDVATFPFVDPPDGRSIKDGIALLEELGALAPGGDSSHRRLTRDGRTLAQLPIDPRFGRMIIEADRQGCLAEVLVIAAGLSIQDPRIRPSEHQAAADEMHRRFAGKDSDFISYLNLWVYLQERQAALSSSAFRRLCKGDFLNYLRVREWQDLHSQLRQAARELRLTINDEPTTTPTAIHQSILAGLLSHIGWRGPGKVDPAKPEYQGARGSRFTVAPGSVLAKQGRRWVMVAELVETDRLRGRVAAGIEPAWAERLGAHLVTRTYGAPRWEPSRGSVVADERVMLFGLTLVASRQVEYAAVDRRAARELFITHALLEGDWSADHAFLERNARLIEEVQRLEDRARRGLLVDDDTLADFYDRRLGPDVCSSRTFDQWWRATRTAQPELLDFTLDDVMVAAGAVDPRDFPDTWWQGDLALPVSYVFDPGAPDDGVTVDVALAILNRVTAEGLDWQVPGLRHDLVTALIRSLPKALRRSFVPAPDYAIAFLSKVSPDDGPLLETLEDELPLLSGDPLPRGNWQWERVPNHLRVTFRVVDDDGTILAAGKDLDVIRRRLQPDIAASVSAAAAAAVAVERTGLSSWDFAELPRRLELTRSGYAIVGFPALVDEPGGVAIRVLGSEAEQARVMWAGTRRLALLAAPLPAKALQRVLSNQAKLALSAVGSGYATVADLLDDCTTAAVDKLMADRGGPAWDRDGFELLRDAVRGELVDTATAVVTFVGRILVASAAVQRRLDATVADRLQPAVRDMRSQLSQLVGTKLATTTGAGRLPDVLRYVRAIDHRLDKLPEDPIRDERRTAQVAELDDKYRRAVAALPPDAGLDGVTEVRWMLEELRVSLFAQVLGTRRPVSPERVLRAISRLGAPA